MTPFEFSDVLGLAKLLNAVRDIFKVSDLQPCNTRILRVKADQTAWFRRRLIAVHRMHDGKWEANPLDPEDPDPPIGPRQVLNLR